MGRTLLGIVIGVVLVPLTALGYLKYGRPPVAVTDPSLPMENFVLNMPLQQRIEFEQVTDPPIKADGDAFLAGAHIYAQECAVCHGFHGQPSRFGYHMAPAAMPLWEKHGNAVGASDKPLGATYWKIANGIRLTGMPAFKGILTPAQMWQVSQLIANADKPLPPAALAILEGRQPQQPVDSGSDTPSGSATQVGPLKAPAGMAFQVTHRAD